MLAIISGKSFFIAGPTAEYRNRAVLYQFTMLVAVVGYPVNIICIPVEPVIAQFKAYKFQDQQAGGHANGKADDVDGGIHFIIKEVSPCNLEIVLYHDIFLSLKRKAQSIKLIPTTPFYLQPSTVNRQPSTYSDLRLLTGFAFALFSD